MRTPEMLLLAGLGELGIGAHAICEFVDDRNWLDEQVWAGLVDAEQERLWHAEFVRRNREIWGAYSPHWTGLST